MPSSMEQRCTHRRIHSQADHGACERCWREKDCTESECAIEKATTKSSELDLSFGFECAARPSPHSRSSLRQCCAPSAFHSAVCLSQSSEPCRAAQLRALRACATLTCRTLYGQKASTTTDRSRSSPRSHLKLDEWINFPIVACSLRRWPQAFHLCNL